MEAIERVDTGRHSGHRRLHLRAAVVAVELDHTDSSTGNVAQHGPRPSVIGRRIGGDENAERDEDVGRGGEGTAAA